MGDGGDLHGRSRRLRQPRRHAGARAGFDTLDTYRDGDPQPIISAFARAATIAAAESKLSAERLAAAPQEMKEMVGSVRSGSALAKVLELRPSRPVLSAADVIDATGVSESSLYEALDRLTEAEVLRPLTERKRGQVWGATVILDELDDLGNRIETASR